jgi:hypothetical protein
MMQRTARLAMATLALLAMGALPAAIAAELGSAAVNAPKSGSQYTSGSPSNVILRVSGRSVEIVAFSFPCREASGRTSLNDFRLKRTPKGYRFNADANGIVSYSDEQADENGKIHISGRFARSAKTVRGHFRVRTPRCGETGNLRWRASR